MTNYATHWRRIAGSGVINTGPCVVKLIIFSPHTGTQKVDIYDGRDAVSGEKFCQINTQTFVVQSLNLGDGVLFGRGVYVDAEHRDDETTVGYVTLND